jgi:ribose transport system permease protein
MNLMAGHARITQEGIVFALARFLFVLFAVGLHSFLTAGNLIWLIRGVAALGMLGLGMGLVVIGGGIDLAMVATMVVAVSWCFSLAQAGIGFGYALLIGAAFVIVVGCITGVLVAYADIPAIFTTLAMGLAVYGVGRAFFFTIDVQNVPDNAGWFSFLGDGSLLHVPMPIIAFALLAVIFWWLLRWTRFVRNRGRPDRRTYRRHPGA